MRRGATRTNYAFVKIAFSSYDKFRSFGALKNMKNSNLKWNFHLQSITPLEYIFVFRTRQLILLRKRMKCASKTIQLDSHSIYTQHSTDLYILSQSLFIGRLSSLPLLLRHEREARPTDGKRRRVVKRVHHDSVMDLYCVETIWLRFDFKYSDCWKRSAACNWNDDDVALVQGT